MSDKDKSKTNMLTSLKATHISNKNTTEVAELLHVNLQTGLPTEEAKQRKSVYGPNDFEHDQDDPLWYKYVCQFKEPMILLLLLSAFVSLCMGQYDDSISITVAIIIVVTVAFIQEYRSERALEALKQLMPPKTHCIRDGQVANLMATELVPGDIVVLGVGDRIPADMRLFETLDLFIDESSFTGETEPVEKTSQAISSRTDSPVPSHQVMNVAFMGTLVRCGSGKGVVVGTGKNSEFGEIFKMMQSEEPPKTPLQKSMNILGKQLTIYSFCIIGLIVLIGLLQGRHLMTLFTIGVSLAVAAIPEGLPIVVTVTLAIGQFRMAKRNAIVKKLPAVETLGCVNVICSDKTGTLTKNEMTITSIISSCGDKAIVTGVGYSSEGDIKIETSSGMRQFSYHDDLVIRKIIEIGCVCNNASIINGILSGQPTEGAFITLSNKIKLNDLNQRYTRLKEWPFSSESKMMMVKCQIKTTQDDIHFIKGAIERILRCCTHYYSPSGPQLMTDGKLSSIKQEASNLGSIGMRVIGLAEGWNPEKMVYCGIVGIIDPPKHKVEEAVAVVQRSGVKVAMITGDALETACFIASKLGIYRAGHDQCMSGDELDAVSQNLMSDVLDNVTVFYRTSPRHKSIIVKAYQARKQIVAMTGDGVNDAVALKSADIGIAMGLQGTDVCKEAAGIVLTDDNFLTIVAAMEEGKAIFHNIRNFVRFQLSTSIAALSLITFSTLFHWPNPLNPMQILWINILMDGPPAQSLGVEPADPEIIQQPPRKVAESIINRRLIVNVVLSATCIVIGTLWIFNREMSDNKVTPRDTTMTFTCFVLFDMFNALSCRSQKKSIFTIGFGTNKVFVVSVGLSLIGQLLVIYFPPLQLIFQTEALNISDLLLLVAIASSVFIVSEIKKFIERNNFHQIHIHLRYLIYNHSQKKKATPDEYV